MVGGRRSYEGNRACTAPCFLLPVIRSAPEPLDRNSAGLMDDEWAVQGVLGCGSRAESDHLVYVVYSRKKCGDSPRPWPDFPGVRLLVAGERVPTMERGGDRETRWLSKAAQPQKPHGGTPGPRPYSISTDPLFWGPVCAHSL
jgi:hypothetical protein